MADIEYMLCNRCLERQMSKGRVSNECYICNGEMQNLDSIFSMIRDAVKGYQFKTFLIGAKISHRMLEREDEIRSKLKIKGRENLKHDITASLGRMLSNAINATVDYVRPELNISIDLEKHIVTVRSRSIYLFGKYTKLERGLRQKRERCASCNGEGCTSCNWKGFEDSKSIEGLIADKLNRAYLSDEVKFTWIGGEDKESLVNGRPFFVKIINPRNRYIKPEEIIIDDERVKVRFLTEVERFPDKPIKFRSRFKIYVESAFEGSLDNLLALKNVSIIERSRINRKEIHELNARINNGLIEIEMVADGGLPIKQFVEGNNVEPSIAQVLGCEARCRSFDILNVDIIEE